MAAIHLYQRRTSDRTGRVTYLISSISSDTRTGTKDVTASTCRIHLSSSTSNTSLEDSYFGTVTYVTILTATIDRTQDSRTITSNSATRRCTTDIDNSLINIA